jgi:hypothetical protein
MHLRWLARGRWSAEIANSKRSHRLELIHGATVWL